MENQAFANLFRLHHLLPFNFVSGKEHHHMPLPFSGQRAELVLFLADGDPIGILLEDGSRARVDCFTSAYLAFLPLFTFPDRDSSTIRRTRLFPCLLLACAVAIVSPSPAIDGWDPRYLGDLEAEVLTARACKRIGLQAEHYVEPIADRWRL